MKTSFMAATSTPKSIRSKTVLTIDQIQRDYPDIFFVESTRYSWHAGEKRVSYQKERLADERGMWAILHEIGHALLDHTDYENDMELLQMEVAAWEKAHELAKRYNMSLDQDYIEDNLDTYRDWLHVRATCPTCFERSLQTSRHTYTCHNCGTVWRVTRSRLCRPYRRRG